MVSYPSNQHCVSKLVAMTDSHEVVASEDIFDEHGLKLLAKGMRIPHDLQDRLLMRKLRAPLESTLTLDNGISLAEVFQGALALIDEYPVLSRIAGSPGARRLLQEGCALPLPPPLVLLMTCARHSGPDSFRRSQMVAALCAGLATSRHVGPDDARALLMAAVLHDLGEVYINPEYLQDRPLLPSEWKHVAVHPRVGMMVVHNLGNLPTSVATCIDQHHERQDGSGYPAQLHGKGLHPLSPLIAVADAVGALVSRGDDADERISLALRIVPGEFDWDVSNAVIGALQGRSAPSQPMEPNATGALSAHILLERLQAADQALTRLVGQPGVPPALKDICHRTQPLLEGLTKSLRSTGILYTSELTEEDVHDQRLQFEMQQVVREVAWRMRYQARNMYLAVEALGDPSLVDKVAEVIGLHDLSGTPAQV